MKRVGVPVLAFGLVVVLLAALATTTLAQPVASIALPDPGGTKDLYPGCNNIGLTFADGTGTEAVAQAVTPAGTVDAIWRHDAALGMWQAYSPAAPQASDLLSVNFLDPVWLCV